jgi:hypothetical protein
MLVCSLSLNDSSMVEAIETLKEVLGDSRCAADSELVAQAHELLGFAFLWLGEHESGHGAA